MMVREPLICDEIRVEARCPKKMISLALYVWYAHSNFINKVRYRFFLDAAKPRRWKWCRRHTGWEHIFVGDRTESAERLRMGEREENWTLALKKRNNINRMSPLAVSLGRMSLSVCAFIKLRALNADVTLYVLMAWNKARHKKSFKHKSHPKKEFEKCERVMCRWFHIQLIRI